MDFFMTIFLRKQYIYIYEKYYQKNIKRRG